MRGARFIGQVTGGVVAKGGVVFPSLFMTLRASSSGLLLRSSDTKGVALENLSLLFLSFPSTF